MTQSMLAGQHGPSASSVGATYPADCRIPRLILLNGPPGIGKSTCARQWVAGRRGTTVVVDIDDLRTSIEGWQEDGGSRLLARQMALEVTDHQLRSGTDVVIPQYLGRTEFIVELARMAEAAGAQFVEVCLVADADDVVARFEARRAAAAGQAHPEHEVADPSVAVADAIARLNVVVRERAGALTVNAHGDAEVTVARLSAVLDQ